MLNREAAQAALKEFQSADWNRERRAQLAQLPEPLRIIGERVLLNPYQSLGQTETHEEGINPLTISELRDLGLQAFLNLGKADRQILIQVLFPKIATHVEAAWQLLLRLPYQNGWSRRSFRSHDPNNYRENRSNWLSALLECTNLYNQDVIWYATWAVHLNYYTDQSIGILLAAAVNNNTPEGDAVYEILCDSARGEQEIGAMGRHVTRALLVADRPAGWEFIEKLLIAAQRQEGLRQVILESIDEAHPEAFKRMVSLILDNDLVRFSATIRAVDVWFGLGWDVDHKKFVKHSLALLRQFWQAPELIATTLAGEDAHSAYLALWAIAFDSAEAAIAPAQALLKSAQAEARFVAAYFLSQLKLAAAQSVLVGSLSDPDLRVATQAFQGLNTSSTEAAHPVVVTFEQIEASIDRFPIKTKRVESILWPWYHLQIDQGDLASALVRLLGDRSAQVLIPYLPVMDDWTKITLAEKLIAQQPWDEASCRSVLSLIGDRTSYVRERVIRALDPAQSKTKVTFTSTDLEYLESLLTRKAADLRRGILGLVLQQSDEVAIASANRLLSAGKIEQRLAGLELLFQLAQTNRNAEECRELGATYQARKAKISAAEQEFIDRLLAEATSVVTLENGLGLFDPNQRTPAIKPEPITLAIPLVTHTAAAIVKSLDELIDRHSTVSIQFNNDPDGAIELLGNSYCFARYDATLTLAENLAHLPLKEVWQEWLNQRPATLRDPDDLELWRTQHAIGINIAYDYNASPPWMLALHHQLFSAIDWPRYGYHIANLCEWLILLEPQPSVIATVCDSVDLLLDACQTTLSGIPDAVFQGSVEAIQSAQIWRVHRSLMNWLQITERYFESHPNEWSSAQIKRYWNLLRWFDQPHPLYTRKRPNSFNFIMVAYQTGAATLADLYDHLIGARESFRSYYERGELSNLTSRKTAQWIEKYPELAEIVENCRDRILEVELPRGDLPTAASGAALALKSIFGIATVIKLLQNLGKDSLIRGYIYDNESKSAVFSHLLRVSFPAPNETPADFAAQASDISQQRLIEMAVYAPQWARFIEHTLQWPNLAEAVLWFHAHTKDTNWQVEEEIRDIWQAQIAEMTPLSAQDLTDGAMDVAWFLRVYKSLKPSQWLALDEAAKYASSSGGHKRAQLFSQAMLGQVELEELKQRVLAKRHQDAVRAIGLIPLAKGKKRHRDLLERYQFIQEFRRTSKQFGAQRQASEQLCARIGLENLARTAGYIDPQRLEWAMEGAAIADLAKAPQMAVVENVAVSLSIQPNGEPLLTITKADKPLKNIPAKLKKNPEIVELQARKQSLGRQTSRMKQSLENSMIRGDLFTGEELQQLCQNPLLQPLIKNLIFIHEEISGYPTPDGKALIHHDGSQQNLAPTLTIRIAHPIDLVATHAWHFWQQECFTNRRCQPFKQVFRELYVLTTGEQEHRSTNYDRPSSSRYAGQQVNRTQAIALFGQRGWINNNDEGVKRTFHDLGLMVNVEFSYGGYTPAEVGGLTIEHVYFIDRKTEKYLKPDSIDSRIFSEVMRDLDLVVSVAHQGGVDPEASASTIEMRSALVQETCRLLSVNNLKLQAPHVLIAGHLGNYSIHLGSAVVHRQPGGSICIIPVHNQERGRLFLPFTDNDPKTAEVISKVLLLAKDQEIQDPTILEQLL
jgi:Family of unknown function (DUF5724)/Domain of unknown function (DUF4132)